MSRNSYRHRIGRSQGLTLGGIPCLREGIQKLVKLLLNQCLKSHPLLLSILVYSNALFQRLKLQLFQLLLGLLLNLPLFPDRLFHFKFLHLLIFGSLIVLATLFGLGINLALFMENKKNKLGFFHQRSSLLVKF